jgi:hypothetical protein
MGMLLNLTIELTAAALLLWRVWAYYKRVDALRAQSSQLWDDEQKQAEIRTRINKSALCLLPGALIPIVYRGIGPSVQQANFDVAPLAAIIVVIVGLALTESARRILG